MNTSRGTAVAGLVVIVVVLAGCGGSSNKQLSYSDFVTKANAICTAGQAETSKATSPTAAAAAAEKAIAKFKKLKPPDALRSAFDRFIAISDQQVAAAKKGDTKAAQALNGASNEAASKMGTQGCISQ